MTWEPRRYQPSREPFVCVKCDAVTDDDNPIYCEHCGWDGISFAFPPVEDDSDDE